MCNTCHEPSLHVQKCFFILAKYSWHVDEVLWFFVLLFADVMKFHAIVFSKSSDGASSVFLGFVML